ncbi:MAG: hypothetical protein JO257_22515 [Deltaproteobacteria bacterium]|nr:hypothetical protein [Deltaproteobacteria bacterium]
MKRNVKAKKKLEVNSQTIRTLTTDLRVVAGGMPPVNYPCSQKGSGCQPGVDSSDCG